MTLQQLRLIADATIPKASNKFFKVKNRYTTGDIVSEVLGCYQESNWQVKNFAPYLKGNGIYDTCLNIWAFLKKFVKYKVDPDNVQWVKEPSKVWADKECDCKSYSIFIASCLKNLGIDGVFRFVSFNKDPDPTHVYIVVRNQGQDIIIDDVMPQFNKEAPYKNKKDYSMKGLYRVSGIPDEARDLPVLTGLPVMEGISSYPFDLNPANKGKFTEKARRAGMSTKRYAHHVHAHPEKYSLTTHREAQFVLNAEKFKHRVSGLPVMGCMDQDPQVGSIFSNIFRGVKKVLSTKQADQYVIQLAPALIYRYLPASFLKFTGVNVDQFFSSLPAMVQQKVHNCDNLLNYMHDNWAQDYYHTDNLLHHTLVAAMGMEPQHYLALCINPIIDTFKNTTATAVGGPIGDLQYLQNINTLQNVTPINSPNSVPLSNTIFSNTASGAAQGAAAGGGAGAAAEGVMALLSSIMNGLEKVNLPTGFNISTIAPAASDWAGYQTAKSLFVTSPTIGDPLGTGINNGIYDSNGNTLPQSMQPNVVPAYNAQGQPVNNTSMIKSGISPLLMLGLAGGAIAMIVSNKKKRKGGKK